MKIRTFFLAALLILSGCKSEPDEEWVDLDELALTDEEIAEKQLAQDPILSPQEILFHEDL